MDRFAVLGRRGRVPALLAMLAYLPMLLTAPGKVSADTKSYLTLDPARLLGRAVSMWDPAVGAGTVTHQNIGFLFPLGPYYWVMDRVGVPDWISQRVLWGTLLFTAALGMWRLMRWLGWSLGPALVAAIAYGWSPYVLSYLARLSVILAPWAALPWLVLLAARAVRGRGWRYPARFALIVGVVGSTNATSLLLVLIGPVLWVAVDLWERTVSWRRVVVAGAQTGVLSAGVSLWWIAGLRVQGTYGIPILRYTETYHTVATASTPAELLRGLGYWFFYGGDRLDQWVGPSRPYMLNVGLIALGFLLVGLALLGLFTAGPGLRHAGVLLMVGLAVSAGASPWSGSTPYAWLFRQFTETTSGMAMRSTPRALPVVVLALAIGLGGCTRALAGWRSAGRSRRLLGWRPGRWAYALVALLLVVQAWPIFGLRATTPSLLRDEQPPAYVGALARWLDTHGSARVLEVPGADFGNYRWGGTVDVALPGLVDRPTLARELVPQGGAGTADLLNALDRRWQEGWFEPSSLVPVATLFGVGTVVARNDLEYERYRLARPGILDSDLRDSLGPPAFAGPVVPDTPRIPMLDPTYYGRPDAPAEFPAVAAYDIDPNAPVLTVHGADVLVDGSGDGLVDIAAAGLLDGQRSVRYVASDVAGAETAARQPGAWLVVTDSNRRQGRRWSGVSSNLGALEFADQPPLADATDNRLDLFADAAAGTETVLVPTGDLADVAATEYGNRITYTPEDAAMFAVDGDPDTAWRGGVFEASAGLRLTVRLRAPVAATDVTLLQPQHGVRDRYVTRVRVTLRAAGADVGHVDVDLGPESRAIPGQRVALPGGSSFDELEVEVLADNLGTLASYAGMPGVGLAEITIPGVELGTTVQMPTAALDALAMGGLAGKRLTVVMTRQRIDPGTPNRFDPEPRLIRTFSVPASTPVRLTGTARVSGWISDQQLSALLGGGPLSAVADRRMPGAPIHGGWAAVDGDAGTRWLTGLDDAVGATLRIATPSVQAGRPWKLEVATGADTSPITAMSVQLATGQWVPLEMPTGGTTVTMPAGVGSMFAVRIDAVDARTTTEYFNGTTQVLPAGIVDFTPVAAPGGAPRTSGFGACRSDLLTLDGNPVAVRLLGTPADAARRRAVTVEACDGPLRLSAGEHHLSSAPGRRTGVDVDRVVLDTLATSGTAGVADAPGRVVMRSQQTDEIRALLPATDAPTWLVLRQSLNAGWEATVDGASLGPPTLIDGYANGWVLPPGSATRELVLQWTPQRGVMVALLMSAFAGLVTLALALFSRHAAEGHWRRPWRASTLARIAWLAGAALLGGWPAAVGAIVVLVAALAPHRVPRAVMALVVTLAGAVAAGWVVVSQFGHEFPPGAAWPDHFRVIDPLVWFAVGLATSAAVLRPTGAEHPSPASADGPPPLHPIGTTPRVVLRLGEAHRGRRRR